jgi:hypothetical protein
MNLPVAPFGALCLLFLSGVLRQFLSIDAKHLLVT